MKIVVPDYLELLEEGIVRLQRCGDVTLYHDLPGDEAETIQRIAGAELVLLSVVPMTAAVIQSNPSLRYILVAGVGYDQVDLEVATAAGVQVINCPTHNAAAVAEYTIALIFAVTRRILSAQRTIQQGNWAAPWQFQTTELRGKRLALIGHGTIGRAVADLATALGLQVQSIGSQASAEEIDRLIAHADVLSLHLPLTPQTRHLIDARRLGLMQPSAYLINTARGAIVDQKALLAALKANQIAGAALDVFEHEPAVGQPHPEIIELSQLEQVVASPHIAYNTRETAMRLADELLENIQACQQGQPINVVNQAILNR